LRRLELIADNPAGVRTALGDANNFFERLTLRSARLAVKLQHFARWPDLVLGRGAELIHAQSFRDPIGMKRQVETAALRKLLVRTMKQGRRISALEPKPELFIVRADIRLGGAEGRGHHAKVPWLLIS